MLCFAVSPETRTEAALKARLRRSEGARGAALLVWLNLIYILKNEHPQGIRYKAFRPLESLIPLEDEGKPRHITGGIFWFKS